MRVVVAEDQTLTREGLVKIITNAGGDVVGEATDYDGVRRLVAQQRGHQGGTSPIIESLNGPDKGGTYPVSAVKVTP